MERYTFCLHKELVALCIFILFCLCFSFAKTKFCLLLFCYCFLWFSVSSVFKLESVPFGALSKRHLFPRNHEEFLFSGGCFMFGPVPFCFCVFCLFVYYCFCRVSFFFSFLYLLVYEPDRIIPSSCLYMSVLVFVKY